MKFLVTYTNGRQFPIEVPDEAPQGQFGSPQARAARIANELAQEAGLAVQRVNVVNETPLGTGTQETVGNVISVGGSPFGSERSNVPESVLQSGDVLTAQTGSGPIIEDTIGESADLAESFREQEIRRLLEEQQRQLNIDRARLEQQRQEDLDALRQQQEEFLENQRQQQEIERQRDNAPADVQIEPLTEDFFDFDPSQAFSQFLASAPTLGIAVPRDENGNPIRLTAEDLPGFPPEILNPNNLFIRVRETTVIDGEPIETSRVITNPAVEVLVNNYGEQLRTTLNLQASADDIIQAQISASGGLVGGPAGSLNIDELEDITRATRALESSGGRLTSNPVFDEQGNRTGRFELTTTPLADQQFALDQQRIDEETRAREQRLAEEALRQSGGLVGGFFTPVTDPETGIPLEDGQQRFVQGFTPQQILQRQEEEARRQRAQELELARLNQSAEQFRNVADLYSNPAQLAAIVASGGSPLLRGQLPFSGASVPIGMQSGAMTPQQTTSSPFMVTNPSGTVFDPNFVPVGGRTIEGDLRRQESNPFTMRDFSGITEDRLRNLSDIELARAQGEAAAQGITPSGLEDIAARNTPGGPLDLTGYLAPRTLFN
tara:strand:- start:5188 stop:7005 length:1818 start_codon:yes stop_codon:yes gene_type:complete